MSYFGRGALRRKPTSGKRVVDGATQFATLWKQLAPLMPEPERERRFHPTRRWRFDTSWQPWRLAVEIHGSVWSNGHHNRGQGLIDDLEKARAATLLGWHLLTYTTDELKRRPVEVIAEVSDFLRWLMAEQQNQSRAGCCKPPYATEESA